MRVFKSVVFLTGIVVSLSSFGQSVSSVYSNNGIGLMNYQGLPHNLGMGEVGIGVPTLSGINFLNPAFLPFNSLTMFQVGMEMDRRNIVNSSVEARKVSGGLRYLNLAFPVVNGRWSTAIGISPYSTVNNKTISTEEIEAGVLTQTQYEGLGGLTAFHWSNGVRVGKSFYAGVKAAALFGSLEEVESTAIDDGGGSYEVNFTDRTSYSGLKFDVAFGYRKLLADERVINFGIVYELSKDLNGTHDQWMETTVLPERQILVEDPTMFTLPGSLGIGASYQILNKLTLGTDLVFTNWAEAGDGSQAFENTYKVGIGAQLIPDYASVNSYLKRVSYRMGVNFGNLPYVINGQRLNELGINIGGSFPVGYSSLDWAVKYGTLGTLENDLIRETYFRIVIGATMIDRWFVKRRYD
jgi:hypothetical protein